MVQVFSVVWKYVLYTTLLLNIFSGVGAETFTRRGNPLPNQRDPIISGLRVEPKEPSHENPIIGYNGDQSVVKADNDVRVVIYGYALDNLGNISFVPSSEPTVDCSSASHNIVGNLKSSFIYTNERFVVVLSFPETEPDQTFRICYSTKFDHEYRYLDNPHTVISTNAPPRVYYFPLYIQITIVVFLLVLSGLFSGLNLGLMSLNTQELQLIIKSGSKTERRYAELILPVRERGNLLLCSLLIGNVLVNSGISILLDDMTSGYIALIGASAGIVVFGEIFPQSLCVKKGLAVGANTIWITRFFMILTWPVAFPISKLLDCILGEEIQSYDRKRLLELIKMSSSGGLQEELKIAVGAMEIIDKTVSSIMTPMCDVFMLPDDAVLDIKTLSEIVQRGYTRIPIHVPGDRNQVTSLLFVKDLVLLSSGDNYLVKSICNFHEHPLRFVMEDTPLRVMLDEFKKGEYHLAMVQRIVQHEDKDPTYELVGVVTLEDIVEEIIQDEIVDETDGVTDNVNRKKRKRERKNFAGLLSDTHESVISVQLQNCTFQWLRGNIRAFHRDFIADAILEKVVRQNCRRVEVTHLTTLSNSEGTPFYTKLYTKGEFSERFILILEGRCLVTIGQETMTFDAGPWHTFGTEMLQKIVECCDRAEAEKDTSQSRSSLVHIPDKILGFVPDYSVAVTNDCTYLEVTAQTWISAYKSTMMISHKGNKPTFMDVDQGSPIGVLSSSRTSLDERKMLFVHPQLDVVRRNGKNRSASESEQVELLPRGMENGSPLSDRSVLSQI